MEFTTLLSLIFLFYGALYFIDHLLKSCLHLPYLYLLQNLGINIRPFQVNVFSTIFNRPISKFAVLNKGLFKLWFSVGAISVVVLLIPSIILLAKNLATQFASKTNESSQPVLQPVVPGINLPVDEFPYYFFTLLLSSFIHEVGHAIAAVGEDVHINGIGFMLLFALPGAYVDLCKESLHVLSPFRQLKVLCAGVWHNVVLAVLAFLIGICLPYILSPIFYTSKGVYVIGVDMNSPVRGINGLNPGDIIESLNYCPVANLEEFRDCLILTKKNEQTGFCISEEIVHAHDETIQHSYAKPDGSVECCDHKGGLGLCFELQENYSEDKGETLMQPYSCLPARIALSASSKTCVTSSQCAEVGSFCLAPSLKNSSRLIKIARYNFIYGNKTPAKDVLYLGSPAQLYYTITATSYIPKLGIIPASLPTVLEALLDYIIKFSGALAVLNLIPCVFLDGYWISGAIIDLVAANYLDALSRRILHIIVTILGTSLLFVTIGVGLWNIL